MAIPSNLPDFDACADDLAYHFPNLLEEHVQISSPENDIYNCISWAAAGDPEWILYPWFWLWPVSIDGTQKWPVDCEDGLSEAAFYAMFQKYGYSPCDSGEPEEGMEKAALYLLDGVPTHAARQLHNGKWTSKLGFWIDIIHETPALLFGPTYGYELKFVKRDLREFDPASFPQLHCPLSTW